MAHGENIYNNGCISENLKRQLLNKGISEFLFSPHLNYIVAHSPAYFTFILPFTWLAFRFAVLLWIFLSHIFLLSSLFLMTKIGDVYKKRPYAIFMILSLVFCFWPLREEMHMANPNSLILLLLTSVFYFFKNKKYFLTGLMLSSVLIFRQYFLLLFLFFLWRKEYRVFFTALFTFLAIEAVMFLVWGPHIWSSYWLGIHSFLTKIHNSLLNYSLICAIERIGDGSMTESMFFVFWIISVSIILFILLYYIRKEKFEGDALLTLKFSLGLVSCLLISPLLHESHYVALIFPIIIIWLHLLKYTSGSLERGLFLFSFLALGLRYSLQEFSLFWRGLFAIFSAGKVVGLIALYFLIIKLIKRDLSSLDIPRAD